MAGPQLLHIYHTNFGATTITFLQYKWLGHNCYIITILIFGQQLLHFYNTCTNVWATAVTFLQC